MKYACITCSVYDTTHGLTDHFLSEAGAVEHLESLPGHHIVQLWAPESAEIKDRGFHFPMISHKGDSAVDMPALALYVASQGRQGWNEVDVLTKANRFLKWLIDAGNVAESHGPAPQETEDTWSETSKHRDLVVQYCQGNGVDLGSSGSPVVPWAIQVDLPREQYGQYNLSRPEADIQWRGSAVDLPFKDETLDWCHSAHLLEDFEDWTQVLKEWDRVLKPGGYLIIAIPDHERFRAYVARHAAQGVDVDNLSHRHEGKIGELSEMLATETSGPFQDEPKYMVLYDGFVNDDPIEYSILWIGKKIG